MPMENIIRELKGDPVIKTRKRRGWLLKHFATNKGQAFTREERSALGLNGIVPPAILSIEQQVQLEREHLNAKPTDLEKYIYLASLQDRNEVLFFRVMVENLAELMPIVYTPTVGRACKEFSHIMRTARGVWLTPDDKDNLPKILKNVFNPDVRLIVVTDNERILGLGDQGAGGMGIPVGKLALYVAGAGIHPSRCLPVSLDVGTNNADLLNDPLYAGYRHRRLTGREYEEFVEAFVSAVSEVYPKAVIQWEDFKKANAFHILERYRKRVPCFNDDIQGTSAVALAGMLAALRIIHEPISDQRILYLGAGAASGGIARLVRLAMQQEHATEETMRKAQILLDSKGIVHDGRDLDEDYKREFALTMRELASHKIDPSPNMPIKEIIARFKPTILVGATAHPGAFTQDMIEEMAKHVDRPLIMPLSNPTSKAECTPNEAIEWTNGKAIVATGSPFPPVEYDGKQRIIGQANNVFIFPGMGLGAMISEIREINDEMFLLAARTLAEIVRPERLTQDAVYPDQNDLRSVSQAIATEIVHYASRKHLGRKMSDEEAEELIDKVMWYPDYIPIEAI